MTNYDMLKVKVAHTNTYQCLFHTLRLVRPIQNTMASFNNHLQAYTLQLTL